MEGAQVQLRRDRPEGTARERIGRAREHLVVSRVGAAVGRHRIAREHHERPQRREPVLPTRIRVARDGGPQQRADVDRTHQLRPVARQVDGECAAGHAGERRPVGTFGVVAELVDVDPVAGDGRAGRRRGEVVRQVQPQVLSAPGEEERAELVQPEVRHRYRPRLVVADVEPYHRAGRVAQRPQRDRRVGGEGRSETGRRVDLTGSAHRVLPHSGLGEGVPDQVLVGPAEPHQVRGQHVVAHVGHAHVAGRLQRERVEHQLDPPPVAGARIDAHRTLRATLLQSGGTGAVALHERGPHAQVGGDPDLAVGMHLGADEVEPDVGEVERAAAAVVVADADGGVAGDVRAGDERGVAGRPVPVLGQVLGRRQVAPGLAHRTALERGDPGVRPGDHPVGDRVRVLMPHDGHVVVTVDARRVRRTGDRLPQEHVGRGRQAVARRALVGVVAAATQRVGLRAALFGVAAQATGTEVDRLQVPGVLREAEVEGPVVHAVVHREEVRHRGVGVVALRRNEVGRVAARLVPLVGERVRVVAVRARRGRRRWGTRAPVDHVVGRVAGRGEGRGAGTEAHVPRLTAHRVAHGAGTAGRRGEAPAGARVGTGRQRQRRGRREHRPHRVVGVEVDEVVTDQHGAGTRVDVAGVRDRVGRVRRDQRDRIRHPRRRGRHGYRHRPHVDPRLPLAGQPGVAQRGDDRLVRGQGGRLRGTRVARQRRRHPDHRAVLDQHGDQAVAPGGQVAEPLPQQYHGRGTDRPVQHQVHRVDGLPVDAEQVAVLREVLPCGGDRIAGQSGGQWTP